MKIVRNTTKIESRVLRSLLCKVHAHMTKLERRKAPNWKNLRIKIGNRSKGGYRGWAYYYGKGPGGWDVHLSLPGDATERGFGWLVYHELMHTYGYRHNEYGNIPDRELEALFPDNKTIGIPVAVKAKAKRAPAGEFPIKIRMTARTVEELSSAEYGSYEDWLNDDRKPTDYNGGRTCHTVEILERHKTVLEIRDETELKEVFWAVSTGLFSEYCPGAADRLYGELARHTEAIKEAK